MAAAQPAGAEALERERLERALAADELALFCQPIRDLRENSYPMAEVLVRMRDEERALLPPGEFLPVLEELGLMPQLDRWVVRQVLQRLKRGGLRIPAFSINLSRQTIADADFPAFVADELEAAGVPAEALLFEFDDADLAAGIDGAAVATTSLKVFGCGLTIDSFGSTGASLGHLKHLRVDFLKLDGPIARSVLSSGASRKMIESIRRIARTLDMGVIASCVEDQDVLVRLKVLGVDYVQGFGIHEPGPIEKIAG